ncbi:MAG: ribose 5-phosphate isomerase B [Planctomycetes bacterium]|nr:ribose 5-phosphate isomerase B [Planctomycetota bacterium]
MPEFDGLSVAIASDHAGFEAKMKLAEFLRGHGCKVADLGPENENSVDYPDFAEKVARKVAAGEASRGVLICGSGIGVSMSANKIAGVRAVNAYDEFSARMSRLHNDANVLCLGSRVLAEARMELLAELWLATPFEGGRHTKRVEKINKLGVRS